MSDARPRLLLIGPTPPPWHGVSGATRLLLDDARLRARFEVTHVDTADRRSTENIGRVDLTNVRLAWGAVREVARAARREHPALCYLPVSQGMAGFTRDALFVRDAAKAGARVVLHLRGGYFDRFFAESPAPFRAIIRATLRRVDRVIVLGESLRRLFEGLVAPERIDVVSNGLTLGAEERAALEEGWAERARRRAGQPAPCEVVYLSNVKPTKGIFELAEAVRSVRERREGVRLVVAGDFQDAATEAQFRDMAREAGGDAAVEYRGVVRGAEKWRLLGAADLFALPTYFRNEGQPWSLIEAMAARLPVISCDHAAIAETVGDGLRACANRPALDTAFAGDPAGVLVPPRDAATLAEALDVLAADAALRDRMGAAAEARQRRLFNQDRFVEGVLGVLERALRPTDNAR